MEIDLKYEGYIKRQQSQIAEMNRLETKLLPETIDYTQIINAHICRILPLYDGERRNAKGRKAGAERFLSVAVDNVAKNIKKHVALRRKNVPTVPIGPLEDDDDGGDGAKDCEGEPFSDRCRCFRDLWFRMDFETLKLMLVMIGIAMA